MADYLNVFADTEIYVVSPSNLKSGGPEALHQLVYYLNLCGFHSSVAYFDTLDNYQVIPEYQQYVRTWVHAETIPDIHNNIIIFPEGSNILSHYADFKNIQKAIWFLSIFFYRGYCRTPHIFKERLRSFVRRQIIAVESVTKGGYRIGSKNCLNLTASHYAFDYLKRKGGNPQLLIEPVSLEIIHYMKQRQFQFDDAENREDIILYNPQREQNLVVAENLKKQFPQYQIIPLKGYSHDEMLKLMNKSKLLIEFGNFPGAERIPKEAVICGMCIIANNAGSARFRQDVVIDDNYKFDGFDEHKSQIYNLVTDIMEHYESHVHNFDDYRKTIYQLEENFIRRIKDIFRKAES